MSELATSIKPAELLQSATVAENAPVPAGSPSPVNMQCAGASENPGRAPFQGAFKIALFFFIVALLAFALNLAINHGLRSIKTSKFGAFNQVMSGRVNADIVISGSSRALCHYDPRTLQKMTGQSAFNLGMNSSQIDVQLAVLKTYLKHNAAPKLVIQNLDLFTFVTTRKGEIYDPGHFLPYLYEAELYEALVRIDSEVWKWKHIPLYGYAVADMRYTSISGLLGCLGISGREDYFLGFNPRNEKWSRDFENFRASNPDGVNFPVEPEGVRALEALIRTCREKGIQVILVYSPEYYEMQKLELNREKIIGMFQEISKRFDVPFWDYSASPLCRQEQLFHNSQHLNADGATLFSADFASRLAGYNPTTALRNSGAEHEKRPLPH